MKKVFSFIVVVTIVLTSLCSCITINSGAAISSNTPIGSKVGEATSTIILCTWSSKGKANNLKKAAENGNIQNVKQVEYIDKSIFFGIVHKHTTRVYGD